jgi:hypothetical protein
LAVLPLLFSQPENPLSFDWITGVEGTKFTLAFRADFLSVLFLAVSGLAAFGMCAGWLRSGPGSGETGSALIVMGLIQLAFVGASLQTVAVVVLLSALPFSVLLIANDERRSREALVPLISGAAITAASAVGEQDASSGAFLVVAALILVAQYPLNWLAGTSFQPQRSSAIPSFAGYAALGCYIVLRWSAVGAPAWELQVLGLAGALSILSCSVLALREREISKVIPAIAAGQLGFFFLSQGQGGETALTAGILHIISMIPIVTGLMILYPAIEDVGAGGRQAARPGTLPVVAYWLLAASTVSLPFLNGSFLAKVSMFASALSDGRWLLAILAYAGTGIMAFAALRAGQRIGFDDGIGRRRSLMDGLFPSLAALSQLIVSILVGALSFTALDVAVRSSVILTGNGRSRPIGGELLLSSPLISAMALFLLLAFIVGGIALSIWTSRRPDWVPDDIAPLAIQVSGGGGALVASTGRTSLAVEVDELLGVAQPLGLQKRIWRLLAGIVRVTTSGLMMLEGRYYLAAVLIFGLWTAIIFLG